MRTSWLTRLLVVALWSGTAWAQRIQNTDVFISMGPAWSGSHVIGGSNVTLPGSTGLAFQVDYGYQFLRMSAASLMVDIAFDFVDPGLKASLPITGAGGNPYDPVTGGVRLMVPVQTRLSFHALAGGGAGPFRVQTVAGTDSLKVAADSTVHGVFVFGGGADVRLSRWVSLRGEVRDLVTGRQLSGASGRHHVLPLFGVAFHF